MFSPNFGKNEPHIRTITITITFSFTQLRHKLAKKKANKQAAAAVQASSESGCSEPGEVIPLPKLSDTEAKNIIQQSPPAKRRRSSILADSQKLQVRIRAVELCSPWVWTGKMDMFRSIQARLKGIWKVTVQK